MDENELLKDAESPEEHMTRLFRTLLTDPQIPVLSELEIEQFEAATQKVLEKLEKSKKMMLTSEDILGVANIFVSSPKQEQIDMIDMEIEELDYGPETPEPEIAESADDSIIILSSDDEPEIEVKEEIVVRDTANVSNRDFVSRLNKEKPFLKMAKTRAPVETRRMDLFYPIGVAHDDISKSWFVSDKQKVIRIRVEEEGSEEKSRWNVIKHRVLEAPTALAIWKDGSKLAVLCSEAATRPKICIVDIICESIQEYCSYQDQELDFVFPARGLARSKGGHLLTMDFPFGEKPRLRVFTDRRRQKSFELAAAQKPSFIASSGTTVVITDLGQHTGACQTVLHCLLDDSDWRNVEFQVLRVIGTTGVDLKSAEMLNKQYFLYVAGAQIDQFGNIIIADAKNHHFKLFKPTMGFIHRISTDFPVPYVSHFHINQKGEILILSTREGEKLHFARLTSSNRLEAHIKSATPPPRHQYKSHVSKAPRGNYAKPRDRSSDSERSRRHVKVAKR